MRDVGGEARVPLDPLLQAIGHPVERRREHGEVARVARLEPSVEHPARDILAGEMAIGCIVRDAGAASDLAQGKCAGPTSPIRATAASSRVLRRLA